MFFGIISGGNGWNVGGGFVLGSGSGGLYVGFISDGDRFDMGGLL